MHSVLHMNTLSPTQVQQQNLIYQIPSGNSLIIYCFSTHCRNTRVSQDIWQWRAQRTRLASVLWHCCLGHL